jgi:hypothetical protein
MLAELYTTVGAPAEAAMVYKAQQYISALDADRHRQWAYVTDSRWLLLLRPQPQLLLPSPPVR